MGWAVWTELSISYIATVPNCLRWDVSIWNYKCNFIAIDFFLCQTFVFYVILSLAHRDDQRWFLSTTVPWQNNQRTLHLPFFLISRLYDWPCRGPYRENEWSEERLPHPHILRHEPFQRLPCLGCRWSDFPYAGWWKSPGQPATDVCHALHPLLPRAQLLQQPSSARQSQRHHSPPAGHLTRISEEPSPSETLVNQTKKTLSWTQNAIWGDLVWGKKHFLSPISALEKMNWHTYWLVQLCFFFHPCKMTCYCANPIPTPMKHQVTVRIREKPLWPLTNHNDSTRSNVLCNVFIFSLRNVLSPN